MWKSGSLGRTNGSCSVGLDVLHTNLTAIVLSVLAVLSIPSVSAQRTRYSSAAVEAVSAWCVLLLAILLVCLLLSSSCARSSGAVATDLLAVQWYWTASGLDVANCSSLALGGVWGLDVSATLCVPLSGGTLITSTAVDVIHSLYLPSVLIRYDCVPGRLSSGTARSWTVGQLLGQCSELCGSLHGFMAYSLWILSTRNSHEPRPIVQRPSDC